MAKRLTAAERLKIAELAKQGLDYITIAGRVDRAPYTVKRFLNPEFRERHNAAGAKWRKENPEKRKECYANNRRKDSDRDRRQYRNNRERRIASVAKHYQKNKKRINDRQSKQRTKRKQTDPSFRIACNLRTRIAKVVRRDTKGGSTIRDLGCTIDDLKTWLESTFTPGMSWDNYGTEWHIDHVKPLVSFDLTNRLEFLQACHFTNLQPLWAFDNLSKGSQEST